VFAIEDSVQPIITILDLFDIIFVFSDSKISQYAILLACKYNSMYILLFLLAILNFKF